MRKQTVEAQVPKFTFTQERLESDITQLAKGAGITLIGRVLARGFLMFNQIVLARLLGPEDFGLYALGWTILRIMSLIAPLGLHEGVIRYGSHYWRSDNGRFRCVLQQSLWLVTLVSVLTAGGLYLAAPWIAGMVFTKPDFGRVLREFALAIGLVAILRVAAAATRIAQRMQFSVFAEELSPSVIQLVLILLFVYLAGWRLRGAILSVTIAFAIGLGLALFFIRRLFTEALSSSSGLSVFMVGELLTFSLPASLAGVFTMLTLWVDRLMVGYFLPASDVGIYQAASQVAVLFAVILSAFNAIFSPMIAGLYHQGELDRLNRLFKVSTKWGLYVSLPLFLVLLIAPREVMSMVFGQRYENGAWPMVILAIGQLVNAGTGAVGLLLIMTGYPKRWFMIASQALLVNILLSWLLIPILGVTGAALASACAISWLFLLGLLQVKRLLSLWPYDKRYSKGLLATLVAACSLALLYRNTASINVIVQLFLMLSVAIGAFVGTFVLVGFDSEDQTLIRVMVNRLVRGDIE